MRQIGRGGWRAVRGRLALCAIAWMLLGFSSLACAATPFAGWAAVVVAGDDQGAHDGTPTRAFDNARRDVAAALARRGFSGANIAQFSLHPELYPADHAARTDLAPVAMRLRELA